jgi:DNA-binding MarR family transcriptional regulator
MTSHERYSWQLLRQLESGAAVSQRSLSRDLGIALGLTNWLLRRMQANGWVEVTKAPHNRAHYSITPAGLAQKACMARAHFEEMLHSYAATRDGILQALAALSATWSDGDARAPAGKRIVFYGTGELAEIAYIGLQHTDLHLVGVVDDQSSGPFFGLPVHPPERLQPMHLDGQPFGRLVVMSLHRAGEIRGRLEAARFPPDRIFWPWDAGQTRTGGAGTGKAD